jgi:hypothetical protein
MILIVSGKSAIGQATYITARSYIMQISNLFVFDENRKMPENLY